MRTPFKIALVVAVLGLGTACVPPPPGGPTNYTAGGALLGAAAGAAIGHDIDPTGGAGVGAVAGALIGGAIGNDMDWQAQRYYYGERTYDRYGDDYDYAPPPQRYDDQPSYEGY